jgi:hypothetical protein
MEAWEVLEQAIPRGEAERIAKLMMCSVDTVRRWRREPEAGDEAATGRRSPLEELMLMFDALNARHPEGIDDIEDFVISAAAERRRIRGQNKPISDAEAERELRAAARACKDAADRMAGRSANGKRG